MNIKKIGKLFRLGVALAILALAGMAQQEALEDFETGDFSKFPWEHGGDASWFVQSSTVYSGSYAAQAGKISHNQRSWLQISGDVTIAGPISFWYKVSSESRYDFLRFYIDGQEIDGWSGERGWEQFSTPVTLGFHTFRWEYTKDGSESSGRDTAWLDEIRLPFRFGPPCTFTLSPGQSIQEAINQAKEGAVICLSEGSWLENLIITKDNLTLRGQGRNETVVIGEFVIKVSQRFIVENMTLQSSFPPSFPPPPCDRIVQPGESIQGAIDRAEEGVVICLAEGTWMENITIAKGLTLRGVGQDKSIVKGAKEGYPVILIESDSEIEVILEGLTISEAKGTRCAVEAPQWICPDGIDVRGNAKVTIKDSTVSGNNESVGLFVHDSANVSLVNSTVSGNGWGLYVWDSAKVSLQGSTVSGNWGGGLDVENSAKVSLVNSTVSGNGEDGLYVGCVTGSAKATIKGSTIEKNGTRWYCAKADVICNGIEVGYKSQTTIIDSIIRNNTDWGVAAWLKKCGYYEDDFTGRVIFQGNNQIYGNGKGDVCLP